MRFAAEFSGQVTELQTLQHGGYFGGKRRAEVGELFVFLVLGAALRVGVGVGGGVRADSLGGSLEEVGKKDHGCWWLA